MHRLEHQVGGEWVPHEHQRVYETFGAESSRPRLFLGATSNAPEVISVLTGALTPPFFILYILHTARGEAQRGRYQSEAVDLKGLSEFVANFCDYLVADARFDLWVYSSADQATVVFNRHNYLYAYGPIDRYMQVVEELGYRPGSVDRVADREHVHFYRSEFDPHAQAILTAFEWRWSPLRPEDEQ